MNQNKEQQGSTALVPRGEWGEVNQAIPDGGRVWKISVSLLNRSRRAPVGGGGGRRQHWDSGISGWVGLAREIC